MLPYSKIHRRATLGTCGTKRASSLNEDTSFLDDEKTWSLLLESSRVTFVGFARGLQFGRYKVSPTSSLPSPTPMPRRALAKHL
jgi:hypothetical protein